MRSGASDSRDNTTERGSALLIVLFVLLLLTGMAVALLLMSETELKMGVGDRRSKQAYWIAEAGLEHGRQSLWVNNWADSFDDDLEAASGGPTGNNVIDFDPGGLVPTFDGYGMLTGFSAGVGDDTALIDVTPFADGAYATFLTNDPIDTTASVNDTNERVMITGVGAGPRGTLEVVQAILEKRPHFVLPPAALTLLGPNPVFQPGSSAAKLYRGDNCPAGAPSTVASVGAIGTANRDVIRAQMGKPTYQSGAVAPMETIADLTDAGDPLIPTPIDTLWTDCTELRDMIEALRNAADIICFDSDCVLPPETPERLVFVDGDYTLLDGVGTLVVTGQAVISGNDTWEGIVLVVGEGLFRRDGGATIEGAMIVADIAGPDNTYGNADDCQSGFESVLFETSGGGPDVLGFCDAYNVVPQKLYPITQFLER